MDDLPERLRDHARLHETVLAQCGDPEQRQWAEDLRAAAKIVEAAARTLGENLHLADGDNCTLIHLKRALQPNA